MGSARSTYGRGGVYKNLLLEILKGHLRDDLLVDGDDNIRIDLTR